MNDTFAPADGKTLPAPTETPADIRQAALAFFPDADAMTAYGDDLLRVEHDGQIWKVRRWRSGATQERVRFVHRILTAGRSAGIETIPAAAKLADGSGSTVSINKRVFDAETWLPGAPLATIAQESGPDGEHVNLPVLARPAPWELTIQAVAALHAATAEAAASRGAPQMPLLVIGEMTRRTWEYHRQQLRPLAPRFPIIQRWIRTAERAIFPALSAIEAAPDLASSTAIGGHQDLWPSHVLWLRGGRDGGGGPARLGGIIDFAEAAASSPLVDLAHLVTHFGGWTADRAETAMGIYSEIRRLSPEERRLLPAVATLDVIAEAGWLLTIAFALPERAAQVASSQLTMGATALVESLEVVTPVLLRGDAPIKPIKRRWEPRRPMPRPDGLARRPSSRPRIPRRPEGS